MMNKIINFKSLVVYGGNFRGIDFREMGLLLYSEESENMCTKVKCRDNDVDESIITQQRLLKSQRVFELHETSSLEDIIDEKPDYVYMNSSVASNDIVNGKLS